MAVRRGASTEHALGLARRSLGDAKAEPDVCGVSRLSFWRLMAARRGAHGEHAVVGLHADRSVIHVTIHKNKQVVVLCISVFRSLESSIYALDASSWPCLGHV